MLTIVPVFIVHIMTTLYPIVCLSPYGMGTVFYSIST